MSELLREIEEDIRAERMHRLWDKFGKSMIRVSIAVIIGTALGVAWQHYQKSQAMEHTSQLLAGLDKMNASDTKAAVDALDIAAKNGGVYADIALLQKGQALEAAADPDGAEKAYKELAGHGSDNAFAVLGKLLVSKETDTPLAVDNNAPFATLQNEMRGWQLLKSGKKDEAVKIFAALRDDKAAPQTQRTRMAMALSTLAPDSAMDEVK
jgi:hypothetical protein